jgi:hypothetical protein
MVTAAMLGLNKAADSERPVRIALLTTTRDWVDDATLREGTAQFVRKVRREVASDFQYAWMREWTTGAGRKSEGIRRTHKHWLPKGVAIEHGPALLQLSADVWGRIAGAERHFVRPVWDAGGLARYMAGLVGHHLKESQTPPSGWRGRRIGTSRDFYARPAGELRAQAVEITRDARLMRRLEAELADELPDGVTADLFDEVLSSRFASAREQPPPRVVTVPWDFWERGNAG